MGGGASFCRSYGPPPPHPPPPSLPSLSPPTHPPAHPYPIPHSEEGAANNVAFTFLLTAQGHTLYLTVDDADFVGRILQLSGFEVRPARQ